MILHLYLYTSCNVFISLEAQKYIPIKIVQNFFFFLSFKSCFYSLVSSYIYLFTLIFSVGHFFVNDVLFVN